MHLSARVFSAAVLSENLPVSGNVFSFRSDFPVMLPALLPYFTTVFSCISSYCVSWHLTHSLVITAIQRRARSGMPCCFPAVRFGLAGSASPIPFRRKDLPTWFHLLCGRLEAFGRRPDKTMPNPVRFAHHVRVSYRVVTFASLEHPTTPLGYQIVPRCVISPWIESRQPIHNYVVQTIL